jgi:hypothetical protein
VVAGVDVAGLQRQQFGLPARVVDGVAGSFELDHLDPVGGQDRDLPALEFVRHGAPPLRSWLFPMSGYPGLRRLNPPEPPRR